MYIYVLKMNIHTFKTNKEFDVKINQLEGNGKNRKTNVHFDF